MRISFKLDASKNNLIINLAAEVTETSGRFEDKARDFRS